ncbi:MAG: hypothetical protein LBP76_10575, partial [Treponema sp.]|nr:hypothetical protein [Treponema sp.]
MEEKKEEKYSPYHTGYNYTIYAPEKKKEAGTFRRVRQSAESAFRDLMQDERQRDVQEIASRMLERLKKEYGEASNETPQGAMIYQLEWILRTQREGALSLPVDEQMISTLLYCYTEYSDVVAPWKDAQRLLNVLWYGNYLMKPPYFYLISREADELLAMIPLHYPKMYNIIYDEWEKDKERLAGDRDGKALQALRAAGEASPDRQGLAAFPLIADLYQMKKDCEAAAIEPPIGVDECRQRYPAYYTVYRHSLFCNAIWDIYIKIQ